MITITAAAQEKVAALIAAEEQKDLALRVAIVGHQGGSFQYDLGFVKENDLRDSDAVIDCDGFRVFIDAASAEKLVGASVDFVEGVFESGFKIANPNSVWSDPVAAAVQSVIDAKINPGVASHGGHVTLLEVKDGRAYIAFGGGCQGCGMASVTLKQGVEVLIKQAVPEITAVLDTTDHASGTNPYFQPAKGGASPLAG